LKRLRELKVKQPKVKTPF